MSGCAYEHVSMLELYDVALSALYRCATHLGSEMVGILHVCEMLVSTRAEPIEFDLFTPESRFLRENALPNELLN